MATRSRGRPSTGVREAVIANAQQALAESGLARLSTKEIAVRAGVAESSIFYHFGDRMGLLQAVIQHQLRPLEDLLADAPAADLRTALRSLLATLEEFFVSALPVMAAVQSDAELGAVYRERSRDLDLGPHRAVDAVVAYLSARGVEAGDLRTRALLLVGAAHQRALQRQLSPPGALVELPSLDAIVEVALPLFETKD
ncbi:TetR/AcrR family transcriptional regulator [Nocardia sp. NPDC059228]|uniref:TetR/AcrR family transcriptional regulator n=1 Tax=Nocardia sp. NPDC059228 TaxID=3346777 RepID=UPI0036A26765